MPAVDKTVIANLALSLIHDSGVIENIETDESAQGRIANVWYDQARRQALADFDYGFARKRLTLTAHGEDPPAEWEFRYQFPSDAIQLRSIENPLGRGQPPIPFEIEQADDGTMSILTDQEDAVLIYTKDEDKTTFFTPHFVLGHAYLLAHFIAGPLSAKPGIKKDMMNNYNLASNTAAAHEANVTARGTEAEPLADWTLER